MKATINRHINKNFPKDISSWAEIPNEHEFYSTLSKENFLVSKTDNYIIFQSKTQAIIQLENDNNLFCDATFFAAPSIAYQLLITRIYAKDFNRYFTTSFTLMKNKQEHTYENVFKDLKKNIISYSNNGIYNPKELHCDFELAISNAFKKVFPAANIKFCLWHFGRALEVNKKIYQIR